MNEADPAVCSTCWVATTRSGRVSTPSGRPVLRFGSQAGKLELDTCTLSRWT
jgi:hypothetical protein